MVDIVEAEIEAARMKIALDNLNLHELQALIKAASKQKTMLAKRRPITTVRRQLADMAAKAGYTIEELFGESATGSTSHPKGTRRRRKSGKVPPKYRDTENPRNTWSGRGSMPLWLASRLRFGHQLTDFLIPGVAALTSKSNSHIGRRVLIKKDDVNAQGQNIRQATPPDDHPPMGHGEGVREATGSEAHP